MKQAGYISKKSGAKSIFPTKKYLRIVSFANTQLMKTVSLISERMNPDLLIEGIVFTMYDSRTNLANEVVENVEQNTDKKIYKAIIPRNVRLAEAPSYGMPITEYDPKSSGARAYDALSKKVIKYHYKKKR